MLLAEHLHSYCYRQLTFHVGAASKWVSDERMMAGVLSSPAPQPGMHDPFLFTPELLHYQTLLGSEDNIIFILWLRLASRSHAEGKLSAV